MGEVWHFDVFQRRVVIRGRLVVKTGLHIGTGRQATSPVAPDDAVIRDADGNPVIPGSSLKGALRAFLERLADAGWLYGTWAASYRCFHRQSQREWEVTIQTLREQLGDNPLGLATAIYQRLCPACRLMGAPHYAGRLSIRDLPVIPGTGPGHWSGGEESPIWQTLPVERSGVGIDRELGKAASGILYEIELVAPGTAFDLEMLIENPSDDDVRNTLIALIALRRGEISLGGGTTRGLGRVVLENVQIWDLGLHRPEAAEHLRAYVLGAPLEDLAWEPLDQLADRLQLAPARPPRVSLARVRETLAGDGEVTWQELLAKLGPLFYGGVRDVLDASE